MVVSFGDCLEAGAYRLHSRFDRVINYLGGGQVVAVAMPQVGSGPTSIVVSEIAGTAAPEILIAPGSVTIGPRTILLPPARRYHSAVSFDVPEVPQTLRNLEALERLVVERAHPLSFAFILDEARRAHFSSSFDRALAARVSSAWGRLRRLEIPLGMREIQGTGHGLTPSGDDFIAGWATALRMLSEGFGLDTEQELPALAPYTESGNPLSRAFMAWAMRGRYPERIKSLLQALVRGTTEQVRGRAGEVLAMGQTSGADFCTGLIAALKAHELL